MNKPKDRKTKQFEKPEKHKPFVMEVCAVILTILSIGVFVVFVIVMTDIATAITAS